MRNSRRRSLALFVCIPVGWVVAGAAPAQTVGHDAFPRPDDLGHIRTLFALTDALGDDLWPGFDTRRIPIAVNFRDDKELLVGHPSPPEGFARLDGRDVDGVAAYLSDRVTRYGPSGGGWAVDLGGEKTAYVGPPQAGLPLETWLSLVLHECFHCYQPRYRERGDSPTREPAGDDPEWAAMVGLESRVLNAAILSADDDEVRELARTAVAVRRARQRELDVALARYEAESEWNEGAATYVQARMFQLLAERGGLETDAGELFHDARAAYLEYVGRLLPPEQQEITNMHLMYHVGMGQCLLLDRLSVDWKESLRERGRTPSELLARIVRPSPDEEAELVAEARKRFAYDALLHSQRGLVEERLRTIRGYLRAEGRRYRIHHGDLPGPFRWKPEGPVYRVPVSLLTEDERQPVVRHLPGGGTARMVGDPRVTIWAGGILKFEKEGLDFRSKEVPIVFRHDYIEWIDPDPAADFSDLSVRSAREEDGVHHDLVMETDGFTLRADAARVERGDDIVVVQLMK